MRDRNHASPESTALDAVLANFVAENALGGVQQLCGTGAIASRRLERILNQVLLVFFDRSRKRLSRNGSACSRRLKARRQVMAVDDLAITYQDCALDAVLEFSNVAGPVVGGQHIYRGSRYPLNVFGVLECIFFEEV